MGGVVVSFVLIYSCIIGRVHSYTTGWPEDVECAPDGNRANVCFQPGKATVPPPRENASCYEWDYNIPDNNISEPITVSAIGVTDNVFEISSVAVDVNALGHMVARPYDCQRGCQVYDRCNAWTFTRRGGCFLKSSDEGKVYQPEEKTESGIENWYVSGAKYSMDCTPQGALVSPCYEYNMMCLFPNSRHHYQEGGEDLTVEECHNLCREIPACMAFTHFDRFPRNGQIVRNVCRICGQKDRKICAPGAVMGHDCGPVPGTTWPPPPVPPLNRDGLHNMPADPSLYWGLPSEPNALATGKKGTAEERSFQRGDIGVPPFLTKPLDYSVRANDEVRVGIANCGCYQFGVQPDPETSTVVANIDLLTYPPASCQELCVEDPECEAFSSTDYKCLLWKNVTEWRLDQVEPIMISGPRLCPTTLIEQGYACSLDHYRAKFSSLSLLMLRIPKMSMPYGESCPTQINPYVFVFIMAACLLVFMAYGYARHTRRRHPSTVVWRVVMAALAAVGTIAHVAFVVSLFRGNYIGILFWVACGHFLAMVLFNEVIVVIYNVFWVTSHPSYAQTFSRLRIRRALTRDKTKLSDSTTIATTQPDQQLNQPPMARKSVSFVDHLAEPPNIDDTEGGDLESNKTANDDIASFCPSFDFSALSSDAVFGPWDTQVGKHAGDLALPEEVTESAPPEIDSSPTTASRKLTEVATPLGAQAADVPLVAESCPPTFTHEPEAEAAKTIPSENTGHTSVEVARLINNNTDRDETDGSGGSGAETGLIFVLFCSFFSIGVLHLCWSKLGNKSFFNIGVKPEAFLSLELLALVGYVPMLLLQLLTVFMSGGDGEVADAVPAATMAAVLLAVVNIAGVLIRFVRGRCGNRA
ncbi:unnamed protein product [Vitrella brassicaformis CCMP3155]|uniref:Apple domain-containing protein n=1 Tax=Vitrella brassicaformis (strain CCMP3155) TaxID=1169540 RepID=A0A0G4EVX9_VITBC|nr:unnamed protein product [Vitrella brassicaformis CCMP3155]|eukprot:CEM02252.1 unnamed protein product [Vitrella brassicaformis CCMP3155]